MEPNAILPGMHTLQYYNIEAWQTHIKMYYHTCVRCSEVWETQRERERDRERLRERGRGRAESERGVIVCGIYYSDLFSINSSVVITTSPSFLMFTMRTSWWVECQYAQPLSSQSLTPHTPDKGWLSWSSYDPLWSPWQQPRDTALYCKCHCHNIIGIGTGGGGGALMALCQADTPALTLC